MAQYKLKYQNSDGSVIAIVPTPNLSAGAGQTVEDYVGYKVGANTIPDEIPQPITHYKRLATPGVIEEKSAGEKTSADKANNRATGANLQTQFDTKMNPTDQIAFLKDALKNLLDGTLTIEKIESL